MRVKGGHAQKLPKPPDEPVEKWLISPLIDLFSVEVILDSFRTLGPPQINKSKDLSRGVVGGRFRSRTESLGLVCADGLSRLTVPAVHALRPEGLGRVSAGSQTLGCCVESDTRATWIFY